MNLAVHKEYLSYVEAKSKAINGIAVDTCIDFLSSEYQIQLKDRTKLQGILFGFNEYEIQRLIFERHNRWN
ncbi:hypothetical protein HYZ97_05250 [Candidatus Pacearchaeota archaeon]|nr:hypothetical protein [Candidatus Pacearchaeota archaeon]